MVYRRKWLVVLCVKRFFSQFSFYISYTWTNFRHVFFGPTGKKIYYHMYNAQRNYNFWWYWNWKRQISPTQKSNFNVWCKQWYDKAVVSNKVLLVKIFKFFIAYKDGKNGRKVRPLCIMLPKRSSYRRDFDNTKYCLLWIAREICLTFI